MVKKRLQRKNITLVGILLGLALLFLMIFIFRNTEGETGTYSDEYISAKELPALLSFTYYDAVEWEKRLEKMVTGRVNYGELENLLKELSVLEYITYEAQSSYKTVTREEFYQIYDQIVDILDVKKSVKNTELLFLGEKAKENTWLTQIGYKKVRGSMEYLHQYDMYNVCTIDGEIAGIRHISTKPILWENVFFHKSSAQTAEIFFQKEKLELEVPGLKDNITDTICDVEWQNKQISAIYKKEDMIQGTVLSYNEKKIEISGYGSLKHSGNLRVYKTYGTVEQLDESKLVIGNLVADFVVAEKEVCGIILKEPATVENIRVLLLNNGSPYYPEVYISADQDYTITINKKKKKLAANTLFKASDFWKKDMDGFIKIHSKKGKGNLYLVNENQEKVSLGYQGSFEIRKYDEGYGIVNELPLEDYLCAVVPSEMPASYEMEALRAQAVCARSYACIQLAGGEYAKFGANVDDTTNYQVYNKQERNEKTSLAVADTVGEVIKFNGEIAEAYYYSTSGGFSQDIDVWNLENNGSYDYLKSVSLMESVPDISSEELFNEFIQKKDISAFDSDGVYFRWSSKLDLNGRLDAVNAAILERRAVNGANVQILDAQGNELNTELSTLGSIVKLVPEDRSSGGVLKKIRIQYENGSVLLITEYNIRKILGTAVTSLTDKNDAPIQGMDLLPSACFCVLPVESGYVLYGGGYGHGIGLSQNGANGMAKAGNTYTDILLKFYQNITIENIYNGSPQQ